MAPVCAIFSAFLLLAIPTSSASSQDEELKAVVMGNQELLSKQSSVLLQHSLTLAEVMSALTNQQNQIQSLTQALNQMDMTLQKTMTKLTQSLSNAQREQSVLLSEALDQKTAGLTATLDQLSESLTESTGNLSSSLSQVLAQKTSGMENDPLQTSPTGLSCPVCNMALEFSCGDRCLPIQLVCDGERDCLNGADEPTDGTCGRNECQHNNGGCEHICVDTRAGHYCQCNGPGYMLLNGTQCQDIDECKDPGICPQFCINTEGSYTCKCRSGFSTHPTLHSCEDHASLLAISDKDIHMISLESRETTAVVNTSNRVLGIDFDFKTGTIFWGDFGNIYRAHILDTAERVAIISDDVATIENLAVDWIYSHIYWTDSDKQRIEVADFDGEMQTTIFRERLGIPRGLAVLPSEGWLFWTDWGENPMIERGGMDGNDREAIVSEGLGWPNGLTLDLKYKKVYWVEARNDSIHSCNFDGSERRDIITSSEFVQHPFSIAIHGNNMYWSDWRLHGIIKANKKTGGNVEKFVNFSNPMTVQIYDSERQPNSANHCLSLSEQCSHLCLPAAQKVSSDPKVSCACPDGYRLLSDGHTCTLSDD